jgi:hypothetical protein
MGEDEHSHDDEIPFLVDTLKSISEDYVYWFRGYFSDLDERMAWLIGIDLYDSRLDLLSARVTSYGMELLFQYVFAGFLVKVLSGTAEFAEIETSAMNLCRIAAVINGHNLRDRRVNAMDFKALFFAGLVITKSRNPSCKYLNL